MSTHTDRALRSPEEAAKPDHPGEMTKASWRYTLKATAREFSQDQCTDLAAALTYYAVLALFPGLIAVLSLLSLFSDGQSTTDALLGIVDDLGPASAVDTFRPVVESLTSNDAAGIALVVGLLSALWSASGYVGAFSRAMNRIYEIDEGRPFWKMRPMQIAVTLLAVVAICLIAVGLVVTGPLARSIGDAVGLGDTAVTVFGIAKWPVLVALVVLIIAVLYYATPNVQQPKFRWVSAGAVLALVVWVVVSVAFGFYVANFGSYDKTYGTLAGVIVFLLWLWITNLALLFGAEFDSELERARQLQAGLPAEEDLQLPPKDTRKIDKADAKQEEALAEARALRSSGGEQT
jgi:membrane protein